MKPISSDVAFGILNALQAENGLLEVSLYSSSWSAGLKEAKLVKVSRELIEFASSSGNINIRWPEEAKLSSEATVKGYSPMLSVEFPDGVKLVIGAPRR